MMSSQTGLVNPLLPDRPRNQNLNPAARSLGSIRRLRDYEILMIGCTDNGNWAAPGGAVDLGESVTQAAVRETLEEAGIECALTGIRDSAASRPGCRCACLAAGSGVASAGQGQSRLSASK